MKAALAAAQCAEEKGEVPIGCVVVQNGTIIATAHNQPIGTCDPAGHAEIIALREAARKTNNYRLPGCTVYVTLEPCMMCFGALNLARIDRLVYGASDQQVGWHSRHYLSEIPKTNHCFEISSGIEKDACQKILQTFFQKKR